MGSPLCGVRNALERARHSGLPIEIEVRTREERDKALDCGATHLLLDNLTPDKAADWIREIADRAKGELPTREKRDNALHCGPPHLLLDTLPPDEAADWIRKIAGRAKVELSGGI